MRILLGLFWALVGGAVGFALGVGAASAYASFTNMSGREGARGFFAVAIGLVGAIIGIATAIVIYGRSAPSGQSAAYSASGLAGIVGLIAVIVLSVWAYMQLIEKPLEYGGARADLEMEFRTQTANVPTANPEGWLAVEVQTAKSRPEGDVGWKSRRIDGAHTIIPVVQSQLVRATSRIIVVRVGEQQVESFAPPMKRTPNPKADWSEWSPPRNVDPPYGVTPSAPLKSVLELRYRVRAWGDKE